MGSPLQNPETLPGDNFLVNKAQKELKINPPDTKYFYN